MEGYEKYESRIQELLFDGMDVHEAWVYMKVMFQIEKSEICFRAYLERSGLIRFAGAGSRKQVKAPDLLETRKKIEKTEEIYRSPVSIRIVSVAHTETAHAMKGLQRK